MDEEFGRIQISFNFVAKKLFAANMIRRGAPKCDNLL